MKHTLGMSWLQLLGKHTKISLQFMFSPSLLTGVNLFILMRMMLQQHQVYFLLPYLTQVMASAPMALFCSFFLAGFQGFTDYRCFHVCKKAVTFEGVTKEVGVVECKPDAASPTWGDTTGEHGMPVFKYI